MFNDRTQFTTPSGPEDLCVLILSMSTASPPLGDST